MISLRRAMRRTPPKKTALLAVIGLCTAALAWGSFLDPDQPWPINAAIVCLGLFVFLECRSLCGWRSANLGPPNPTTRRI